MSQFKKHLKGALCVQRLDINCSDESHENNTWFEQVCDRMVKKPKIRVQRL